MNILVLGATGFVGKYFSLHTKNKYIVKTSSKVKKGYIKFDFLKDNLELILKKYQIKKVVFLSAISKPEICDQNKIKSNLINVKKTKKNINLLIKKNIYFIFFSSEYVFNGKRGKYSEKSIPQTNLLYGKQKKKIEEFLKNKKKKKFSILRIAKTFGDTKNDGTLFTSLLKQIKSKKIIYSANDQYFSALYVRDLIKVIDYFLKNKINGLYNVCGNENYSRYVYTKKFFNYLSQNSINLKPANLYSLTNNHNLPLNVTMTNKKICRKLNFKFTKFESFLKILKQKNNEKNK